VSRRRRLLRALAALAAVSLAGVGVTSLAASPSGAARTGDAVHGRALFVGGCSACHAMDARGIRGRGPSLVGVGARAADFYLRTGRMPLAHPRDYPVRAPSLYSAADRADLIAYVAGLGTGPPVPPVDPARGSLVAGKRLFTENCAGCHQIAGQGGVVTPDVIAPSLQNGVQPIDVAEAVRIGPYVMPRFSEQQLSQADVNSLARYVQHLRHLPNPGGWGIGNIGPIPEGFVVWALGLTLLIVVARIIGKRTPR
jgi:ubiquinol-cytochrome c reductase cytochrome c subunit